MVQFWEILDKHPNGFYLIALVFVVASVWRFFVSHFKQQSRSQIEQAKEQFEHLKEQREQLRQQGELHKDQTKEQSELHRQQIDRMTASFMDALDDQRELQREGFREMMHSFNRLNDKIDRIDRPA